MDGSRIEGSHKGWNSIQRSQPSGIEVYSALGHDFVLRRNIRVGSARIQENKLVNLHEFITSTHTSHHIKLTDYIAALFNSLYEVEPTSSKTKLKPHPTLPEPAIFEAMGLVESNNSMTFGGLVDIGLGDTSDSVEMTMNEEIDPMLEDIDAEVSQMDQSRFMKLLGVTEELISRPMPPLPGRDMQQIQNPTKRKVHDTSEPTSGTAPQILGQSLSSQLTDDSPSPVVKRQRMDASSDHEDTTPEHDGYSDALNLEIVDSVSSQFIIIYVFD